jgi:hypothetical protein
MASFDEILAQLHTNATLEDVDEAIVITSSRQFQIPANYNLTIGYAGDVNSQIITFNLPLTHESHSLFDCQNKKIKWKNMVSGTEGFSTLINPVAADNADDGWTCQWEVPPEAMTQAGNLEVAIALYDISKNGKIAFAWNTPSYKGFTIGESFADIGLVLDDSETLPAADEILSINAETRMIVAPKGYNMTIANYGDIGITNVYFQVNKYLKGMDISDTNTKIKINAKFNDYIAQGITDVTAKPITEEGNKVLIKWPVSPDITSAIDESTNEPFTGTFTISITFSQKDGKDYTKRWTSAAFSGLTIAPSLLTDDAEAFAIRNEQAVEQIIDTYFDDNEFTIEEEIY